MPEEPVETVVVVVAMTATEIVTVDMVVVVVVAMDVEGNPVGWQSELESKLSEVESFI